MWSFIVIIYNAVFYVPLLNGLFFLTNILPRGDLGTAVIILTIFIRLLISPLNHKMIKTQQTMKKIEEVICFKKTKQLILVAGMGGGAGSTALAYLSKLAHEKGIKVVAIITKPLKLEGKIRILEFRKYFKKIHNNCDKIILLNNEKLANFCQKLGDTSIHQVFDTATDCLANLIIQELLKKIPNYRICEFLPTKKDGILNINYKKIEA